MVMVIVPAFNEGRAVKTTVERLLEAGYQVVVGRRIDGRNREGPAHARDLSAARRGIWDRARRFKPV
jgi:hypothetical protein